MNTREAGNVETVERERERERESCNLKDTAVLACPKSKISQNKIGLIYKAIKVNMFKKCIDTS